MQGPTRFFKPWIGKKPNTTIGKNFITPFTSSGINFYKGNSVLFVTPFAATFVKKDNSLVLDKHGSVSFEFVNKVDDKLNLEGSKYYIAGIKEIPEILITDEENSYLELNRKVKVQGKENGYNIDEFTIAYDDSVDGVKLSLTTLDEDSTEISKFEHTLTKAEFYLIKKLIEQNLNVITGFTPGQVNVYTEKPLNTKPTDF